MSRLVERVGDRLAAGLRRLADNSLAFWLGGAWEALVVHVGYGRSTWLLMLAALGVLAAGVSFVRWWEHRRLLVVFRAAAGRPGLVVLPPDGFRGQKAREEWR